MREKFPLFKAYTEGKVIFSHQVHSTAFNYKDFRWVWFIINPRKHGFRNIVIISFLHHTSFQKTLCNVI